MKKWKGFFALLVFCLLVGSAVHYKYEEIQAGPSQVGDGTEQKTLKIAYLPITHALPLFKAKELLGEREGVLVELVKYGSWSELMDALNTGRADGASVLIELAMKAREQGILLELSALGHRDGNVVITANEITEGAQLRGKTFAIPGEQSSHNILLQKLLSQNNISREEVTILELAPAEMPSALRSGQIDGYCVAEPFGAKAVSEGIGRVFATSEELWKDSVCCGIVWNQEAVKEKEDAVILFEEVYQEAGNALTDGEAERIAEEYLGQSPEIAGLSLSWISFQNLTVSQKAYKALTDNIKEFGLSENPPSFEEFVEGKSEKTLGGGS